MKRFENVKPIAPRTPDWNVREQVKQERKKSMMEISKQEFINVLVGTLNTKIDAESKKATDGKISKHCIIDAIIPNPIDLVGDFETLVSACDTVRNIFDGAGWNTFYGFDHDNTVDNIKFIKMSITSYDLVKDLMNNDRKPLVNDKGEIDPRFKPMTYPIYTGGFTKNNTSTTYIDFDPLDCDECLEDWNDESVCNVCGMQYCICPDDEDDDEFVCNCEPIYEHGETCICSNIPDDECHCSSDDIFNTCGEDNKELRDFLYGTSRKLGDPCGVCGFILCNCKEKY